MNALISIVLIMLMWMLVRMLNDRGDVQVSVNGKVSDNDNVGIHDNVVVLLT